MNFRRDMGRAERAIRLVVGFAMILCGGFGLHASPVGLCVAALGAVGILTAAFGHCPACALAGRAPPARGRAR